MYRIISIAVVMGLVAAAGCESNNCCNMPGSSYAGDNYSTYLSANCDTCVPAGYINPGTANVSPAPTGSGSAFQGETPAPGRSTEVKVEVRTDTSR